MSIISSVSSLLWGPATLVFVLGCHIMLTVSLKFPQRFMFYGIKESLASGENRSALSALCVNLAATLGVGNITGIALAVAAGGPGAVFWCWISGCFAVATQFAECYLSRKFKGAPMTYMKANGFGTLSYVYGALLAASGLLVGAMIPANAISETLASCVSLPNYLTGAVICVLTGLVLLAGADGIFKLCTKIMPYAVIAAVLAFAAIIISNFAFLPEALGLIVKSAFTTKSVFCGVAGYGVGKALRYGISRGIFSNEAGLGSSAVTAAAMESDCPIKAALICATSTFWDTVVICAITGVAFVTAMCAAPEAYVGLDGLNISIEVFRSLNLSFLVPVLITVFGFSSIIGWFYIGNRAYSYMTNGRGSLIYKIIWLCFCFLGCTASLELVWDLSDIFTAVLLFTNLTVVVVLRRIILRDISGFSVSGRRRKR